VLIGRHGSPGWSDILAKLKGTVDLVVDNVGGAAFPDMLELLRPGGTLITSGAIAGPVVDLDLRTLYLRDLRLLGTTRWADEVLSAVCCLLSAVCCLLSAICYLLSAIYCLLSDLHSGVDWHFGIDMYVDFDIPSRVDSHSGADLSFWRLLASCRRLALWR
jgi:hypothetical protein